MNVTKIWQRIRWRTQITTRNTGFFNLFFALVNVSVTVDGNMKDNW
jgi:hypothetical protein